MNQLPEQLRSRLGGTFAAGGARYDQLRPGYPDDAVGWLVGGTRSGARVADVGAGTGKLTTALVDRGFDVIAVDPSADMLAQLQRRRPTVATRLGTGEATGLAAGSVALVTFAQSWHWVAPDAGTVELARIVGPGGTVAMAWNFVDVRVAWVAELAAIWHSLATHESIGADRHAPELGAGFGQVETTTVDWEHTTTIDALAALVTTRSYYLAAAPTEQDQIRADAADFLRHQHPDDLEIAVPYRTHCYRVPRLG